MRHSEKHRAHLPCGWLRAAVLCSNDGIVSTASLVLGVAAVGADTKVVSVAVVAGLVAGAMSMAQASMSQLVRGPILSAWIWLGKLGS